MAEPCGVDHEYIAAFILEHGHAPWVLPEELDDEWDAETDDDA